MLKVSEMSNQVSYTFGRSAILNPNRHEAGVKVPSQHPISTLTKLFFFSTKFSFCSCGVMDKAVGYVAKGPWFDPCLRQFFSDLDNEILRIA